MFSLLKISIEYKTKIQCYTYFDLFLIKLITVLWLESGNQNGFGIRLCHEPVANVWVHCSCVLWSQISRGFFYFFKEDLYEA